MTNKHIRILVAEDHDLVRKGICVLISSIGNMEIVGEASDGREAYEKALILKPDVILMDIGMPEMNGLEVTTRLHDEIPAIKVIILSMFGSERYVIKALRAGACGYLLKNSQVAELETALDVVLSGGIHVSPHLVDLFSEYLRNPQRQIDPLGRLSSRQREILQLVAEGHTTKDIAAKLSISIKTVEAHRSRMMKEIKVKDMAGLIKFAIRVGLTSVERALPR